MRNWNRKTSSSKLSSVSTSFSTAAKGNFNHNRRTLSKVPENVDPTRTAFNKILIDKDIRQVYKEVFGEALAEYNANQVAKKHPERQKKDYYSSFPPLIYSRFCQTCITNTICFFSVRMF